MNESFAFERHLAWESWLSIGVHGKGVHRQGEAALHLDWRWAASTKYSRDEH